MTVKTSVTITPPNFQHAVLKIIGTAPYVQNKFSTKTRNELKEKHQAGSTAKKGKKREAKDFQRCYEEALHKAKEGWFGMPAPAFRNAMISACRIAGFAMTRAKLSIFVEADGFDFEDGTPLVRITKGEPRYSEMTVRNETGVVDIRPRPMWDEWEAILRIRYDADQFTLTDIVNLLHRAGIQVGIGEGRPDSKKSNGMGWGTFRVEGEGENA